MNEPQIVDIPATIQAIGLIMETSTKTIYRDIPKLGKLFTKIKKSTEIPHRALPWRFVAISKNYNPKTTAFSYFIGDVVTKADNIPAGLVLLEIPPGKYAIFRIQPPLSFLFGWYIGRLKREIYNQWLPQSIYQATGIIDDYELHDSHSVRFLRPIINLYVAISEKSK